MEAEKITLETFFAELCIFLKDKHTVDLSIVRGPCTTVTDVLTIN